MTETNAPTMPDMFDRAIGLLHDLPDVTQSKPSTIVSVMPMLGRAQTFIVQTYRQAERGDFIFVQTVDADGSIRIAIPPSVADAIARQRDALTTKVRRVHGKRNAEARKAAGIAPFGGKARRGRK